MKEVHIFTDATEYATLLDYIKLKTQFHGNVGNCSAS
jgi:hypothetical protein